MYFYVGYQSAEETERIKQRREIELSIREVIDEMARYTGNTLNATASVTMMDDRGAYHGFSFRAISQKRFSGNRFPFPSYTNGCLLHGAQDVIGRAYPVFTVAKHYRINHFLYVQGR